MKLLAKLSITTLLIILVNYSIPTYTAQEILTTTAEDNKVELHWKKLNDADFLIRRNDTYKSIAILPVRGQNLVKVITDVEPIFSISNGSGLFQGAKVTKVDVDQYVFNNLSAGIVWLRLVLEPNQGFDAFKAKAKYFSTTDFLYPLNKREQATTSRTTNFKLSNNSDRVEKIFIDELKPYSFNIQQTGVLLFRHQIDYEQIDSQFDVLYQVGWEHNSNKNIRNYTTRPEVKRLYEAECLHQLGQRKDSLINIEKAGKYTFSSNQPIQAEFYMLSDKQVLLDRRSKITPYLEKNIELLDTDNEIVNNFNTYIDQNLYREGLNKLTKSSDNKQILSLIRAKHSFFKPLHPVRLQEQKMLYAYYSIYSDPELATNKNDEFYLNENLTDAITKKISTGYFYPFGQLGELEYELASETFENKLRIAVANIKPQNSKITLIFDSGEELDLSIESSFTKLTKKLNVVDIGLTILNPKQLGELATLSSEFASKKPVAPFLNSVTGLIEIPENAKSFKVKSSDGDVWVSIAYPQRSFYRGYEYADIKDGLTTERSINKITAFVQNYQVYKKLQKNSETTQNVSKVSNFLENLNLDEKQDLQAWTPYYREIYNAELEIPEIANTKINFFTLSELQQVNESLFAKRQNRLRKDTLLAHAYYSDQKVIRSFAFNEYVKIAIQNERYRQILDLAHVLLIRHGDDDLLNTIGNIHQRLGNHKKAIFYFSLKPLAVDIDKLLSSLFYARQWGLFEALVQKSENVLIWNRLKLFQLTGEMEYFTIDEKNFVDELGHSWVNEDRFLLNYSNSQLIQSVSTLSNKQIAYINSKNSATVTVKGPLSLRLRIANEFTGNTYTKSKFKLQVKSENKRDQVYFRSVPAKSWKNINNTLVGTFGKIDLEIPAGVQEYTFNMEDGSGYIYIENKRNLLGLNLISEETVDAEFVRENAIFYNRRDANRKRNVGYLKSSCKRLRKLVQRPIKTFQPVDINLNLRDDWIKQQKDLSTSQLSSDGQDNSTIFTNSYTNTAYLNKTCLAKADFRIACIETMHEQMLSGNTIAAVYLLDYIDKYPEIDLSSYKNDLFELYDWQLIKSVRQSDGSISLESDMLQEDSLYLNSLKNDFTETKLSSLFITGTKVQGFKFAKANKDNTFVFQRLTNNKIILKPIIINYQIDNEAIQTFDLQQSILEKPFMLSPNQSELKIWLAADSSHEYVSIFQENSDLPKQNKDYHVATTDTPVILFVKGPQRLKIVSQVPDGTRSITEKTISSDQQLLDFPSLEEETYFRFFNIKPNYSKLKVKTAEFSDTNDARMNSYDDYRLNRLSSSLASQEQLAAIDSEIYNIKKSTYDFSLSHGRSLDEEQATVISNASQYSDIQGRYRYYSPDTNFYWSGDGKLRTGTAFTALFGNIRADWLPESSPFEYSAHVNDWLYFGDNIDLNAFSAGLGAAYNISYKYNHRFTTRVNGFYRNSFGDNLTRENISQVHNSIWSTYKEDHKFGISGSQRWTFNAYKDSQLYADAKLQTNESPISIDYVQASLGYRQLYDTASLEASIINRNYFSDDDRDQAITSNRFKLAADWLIRSNQDSAFKLGVSYFNNISASKSAFAINFTWLYHRGNYLEDYRPGEYRFRSTRERRLLENTFDNLQGTQ